MPNKSSSRKAIFRTVLRRKTVAVADKTEVNVKDMILAGKGQLECVEALLKADESLSPADALEKYSSEARVAEASKLIDASVKQTEAEKAQDVAAKELADKALAKMDVPSLLAKAEASGAIIVKEPEGAWKRDQAKMFRLLYKAKTADYTEKDRTQFVELRQKFDRVWAVKLDGNVTDAAAPGGNFVRPEFDPEVDKLVYKDSVLIKEVKIRPGGDKTDINSLSTFDFTLRADQNAPFAQTKPTTDKLSLEYREAGAVVPVSPYMLEESEPNFISELIEGAADAKIRHLEPAITTGKVSDGDAYDGIRFHTGVTAHDVINAAGTGKLLSKDLTNAWLAAASQTRNQGTFILDTREFGLLKEERDDQNLPIKTIELVNGQWIHLASGRPIIISDLMSRVNTALTSNTGGSQVGALFGVLPRFRIYQRGAMDIDQSKDIFFIENQIAFRFILRYKFGIPIRSRSSFVTLQGVQNVAIS